MRTSTVTPVPLAIYAYDANDRLLSDAYDDNGNTLGSGGNTYAYDFENRLTELNNGAVTMVNDGDSNRVAKTANGVTTYYLVDERNLTGYAQVLEEISGGTVQRQYTYGLDLISQRQTIDGAWEASFYGYDGHGSVRMLANFVGSANGEFDYDAFGIQTHSINSFSNAYLYSGEQYDLSVGAYNLRARYYNQENGGFLTADPFEGVSSRPVTQHGYQYASNEPVLYIDPSGRFFDLLSLSGVWDLFTFGWHYIKMA